MVGENTRSHVKNHNNLGDEESRAFSVHRTVHLEKEDVDVRIRETNHIEETIYEFRLHQSVL